MIGIEYRDCWIDSSEIGPGYPSEDSMSEEAENFAEFFENAAELEIRMLQEEYGVIIHNDIRMLIDDAPIGRPGLRITWDEDDDEQIVNTIYSRMYSLLVEGDLWDRFLDSRPPLSEELAEELVKKFGLNAVSVTRTDEPGVVKVCGDNAQKKEGILIEPELLKHAIDTAENLADFWQEAYECATTNEE
jgi:hypothetical protein